MGSKHKSFILIHEMMEHYISQYTLHKKETDNISVAHGFQVRTQEIINEAVKDPLAKDIKCGKGCSFCCSLHVDITDDEAELLVKHAIEENIQIDVDRLSKQESKTIEQWSELTAQDRKCVFLDNDNGCCKVYEYRPISCRTLLVVSDPKHCDTDNPESLISKFSMLEANIVASAVMNATNTGTMAKLLLDKLT